MSLRSNVQQQSPTSKGLSWSRTTGTVPTLKRILLKVDRHSNRRNNMHTKPKALALQQHAAAHSVELLKSGTDNKCLHVSAAVDARAPLQHHIITMQLP